MPDIKKYLNRDGLDEYNSLLPHSSAEMQTYVNDWLDDHPEATTTVQDGAITEPKLADKSVSLRTLADDTVHMLKGAILTGNLSGNVLSADDAYSAPPVSLTVDGKSTQVSTTGKNLAPTDKNDYTFFRSSSSAGGTIVASGGSAQRGILIPVEPGESLRLSHREVNSGYFKWCDGPIEVGSVISGGATIDNYTNYTLTNTDEATKNAIFFFHNSSNPDFERDHMQIERGTVTTEYEPYTGGVTSPSPMWPQSIASIDTPSVLVCGRNLLDPALVEQGGIDEGKKDHENNMRCRVSSSFDFGNLAGSTITCTGLCAGGTFQWAVPSFVALTSTTSGWLNSGDSYTIPAEAENIRMLFRRSDDAVVTTADFSNIQLELGSTATAYHPYVGVSTPLGDVTLRSLPNGTKDTLALGYLRPSTREGWAWYTPTMVRRVGEIDPSTISWRLSNNKYFGTINDCKSGVTTQVGVLCTALLGVATIVASSDIEDNKIALRSTPYHGVWVSVGTFNAGIPECSLLYPLDNQIVSTLTPIELPFTAAPNFTIWSDPNTGLQMEYVRDANIVVQNIEQAIADQ